MTIARTRFVIRHQFYDFLRLVGMRDRLRCPACGAVGTWKPHGGWLDREDARGIRRWLCKWCGIYQDTVYGTMVCSASPKHRVWIFTQDAEPDDVPYRPEDLVSCNPWAG